LTDILFSFAALVFLLPAIGLIALALLIQDGRPIFYRHRRIGRDGREFGCLKFRTMRRDAEAVLAELLERDEDVRREWAASQKLKQDPRVHRIGQFLRNTSLDEIPQFLNVLRGEMSIVGPRPIITDEVPHYGENFVFYLSMTPGVTGLWQVSRRSDTSYAARVAYDVDYFSARSMRLDMKIMVQTVAIVLFAKNVG
jgi:exopolysaccharide production protein ExoY